LKFTERAIWCALSLFGNKRFIILLTIKTSLMKKAVAFVVLLAFISACSQYTCPTYSKKEVKSTGIKRI